MDNKEKIDIIHNFSCLQRLVIGAVLNKKHTIGDVRTYCIEKAAEKNIDVDTSQPNIVNCLYSLYEIRVLSRKGKNKPIYGISPVFGEGILQGHLNEGRQITLF